MSVATHKRHRQWRWQYCCHLNWLRTILDRNTGLEIWNTFDRKSAEYGRRNDTYFSKVDLKVSLLYIRKREFGTGYYQDGYVEVYDLHSGNMVHSEKKS